MKATDLTPGATIMIGQEAHTIAEVLDDIPGGLSIKIRALTGAGTERAWRVLRDQDIEVRGMGGS